MPCLLLCLIVLAAPGRVVAQGPVISPAVVARIDSIFAPYDHDDSPGYAVGIIQNRRLVFAKGYGRADLDHNVPITPRTSFHLASLSKQFTAAYGADLRLKHLLYFTSGLPEYTSLPRAHGMPWFSAYYFTIDEAIGTTLRADSLSFAPGTRWQYSNVNYMLLAKIVERVSGMSLARFLGPAFAAQMLQTHRFAHDKHNDAFGLVFGRFMGREMIWFSGGDLDTSTFMARLPAERLTIICLSNMPRGDAEGRAKAVLRLVLESGATDHAP